MSYRNQSVINSRGGAVTISNTDNREYVSIDSYHGNNIVLNKGGVSIFSPNNYQQKVDHDTFKQVGNDDNLFVGGNKYDRVNDDYSLIVGDSSALYTDKYNIWNEKFTTLATANLQPDVKKPVIPVLPGVPIENTPPMFQNVEVENPTNPAIKELQQSIKSGKTLNNAAIPAITLMDLLKGNPPSLSDLTTRVGGFISATAKSITNVTSSILKSIKGLPGLVEKLKAKSPSTQGAEFEINTAKDTMPEIITETQKELMSIEAGLGRGGNMSVNVARNARWVIGAATNTNPQATVDMTGRQVPSTVVVGEAGTTTAVVGVPEVSEVDNSSMFPCGNFTLEVGNGFNVRAGGGGVTMITSGGVNISTDTVLKLGALQTVVGAKDVNIRGEKNVSISSPNLNLTSDNQIVLNSNVGVNSNLIVKGGVYTDGEMYVNHITAPREIQQTLLGFTKEGARGFLRLGGVITGIMTFNGETGPFVIVLDQQKDNIVELTPHAHEFPNIPLTLHEGNADGGVSAQGAVRGEAASLNSQEPSTATGIVNEPKYPKGSITGLILKLLRINNSSMLTSVTLK